MQLCASFVHEQWHYAYEFCRYLLMLELVTATKSTTLGLTELMRGPITPRFRSSFRKGTWAPQLWKWEQPEEVLTPSKSVNLWRHCTGPAHGHVCPPDSQEQAPTPLGLFRAYVHASEVDSPLRVRQHNKPV
eukprot:4503523-Amphidinium_carterae.1